MEEIRCGACRRKLGMGVFSHLVIKCPRCGAMNTLRAARPTPERPERLSTERVPHAIVTHHSLAGRQTPPG
ncbi:Com family DNA-binding transcriptional regulator [Variovorax sp. RKNM96]|uniref:Com family DNA-binding transcriptional regulator n=1 Tax=Variovorax sp. RKNM96 TaxID=2681552 RepID=UPI00197EF866|nr:Com family DNA-binding transcriptional regulator [Variovorax sp. RKNM96]QSI34539.1 Com family DNA-binding transcriptional regulator [Variovorax sp. RKNM96]